MTEPGRDELAKAYLENALDLSVEASFKAGWNAAFAKKRPARPLRELRYDSDGQLDDVAIGDVTMFRLERMSHSTWWACVYLGDNDERISFNFTATRKHGLIVSADEDVELARRVEG